MTAPEDAAPTDEPARQGRWAIGFRRFALDGGAPGAAGFTVSGRRLTGPEQGFGRMWRRTYTAVVPTAMPPTEILESWRQRFGSFWPRGNTFHGTSVGIEPGAVAPISVDTGAGVTLATGVLVLYADDESFTFMTPEGHMFAGWITFSVTPAGPGEVALRIEILLRPSDPLYEAAWPVMRRMETRAWEMTLRNVAREVCGYHAVVTERTELIDRRLIWANWRNVRYNAGVRSAWWATGGRVVRVVQARRRPH